MLLVGCAAGAEASLLDPHGPVAATQKMLLLQVTPISLLVVLPVILLVAILAWRYRHGNKSARYQPDWSSFLPLEIAMWGIPVAIVLVLGVLLWRSTLSLDPATMLPSGKRALRVQVVGLDWKWLFIYPLYCRCDRVP
jgi:cytochrome o ubiquinol oxidase subunit 2